MSRYSWTVRRKGEKPKKIRSYKWLTKMYSFVLRNPAMFRGRSLTIHDGRGKEFTLTWDDIEQVVNAGLKEGNARADLFSRGWEGPK